MEEKVPKPTKCVLILLGAERASSSSPENITKMSNALAVTTISNSHINLYICNSFVRIQSVEPNDVIIPQTTGQLATPLYHLF